MLTTFVRETSDGRKIEVIGPNVCVDGKPVADKLVDVKNHPNKEAILFALPNAAFMAGPVALTAEESSIVRGALNAAKPPMTDRIEITERFRKAWNARNHEAGIE
jgi:hypothetical protein